MIPNAIKAPKLGRIMIADVNAVTTTAPVSTLFSHFLVRSLFCRSQRHAKPVVAMNASALMNSNSGRIMTPVIAMAAINSQNEVSLCTCEFPPAQSWLRCEDASLSYCYYRSKTDFVKRLVPAHAGNTTPGSSQPATGSVHPRTRGEHRSWVADSRHRAGSSPHTRGTRS